jgi:glycosyltransferase involved in cell wall biosynthesis
LEEKRQGAPFTRNRGLSEAKGSWIQYLDGDDILLPPKLDYQLSFAETNTGFIYSAAFEREVDGTDIEINVLSNAWAGLFIGGGKLGFTSSILWNKAALKAVQGWNINLRRHQEYELMFRLLQVGYKAIAAPQAYKAYTIKRKRKSGQITDIPYSEILLSSLEFRSSILEYALDNQNFNKKIVYIYLREFFRRYTRLKVRRPDYARQIEKKFMTPLLSHKVCKKYPLIYWLKFKSLIFIRYKWLKAKYGIRKPPQANRNILSGETYS